MVDSGDTAWLLASSALVLVMTPALAFFYGGMVHRKHALSTIMQSFIIIALISVQWVLWGYSLAFGPDKGGIIGGLEWLGLRNVGLEPNADYAGTVPHQAFMIFQAMFAIITPALITGAFAGRMKFKAFLIFILLWATLVYDPVAHWVWGVGGWLRALGALDFAGGTVVHIASGVAALAAALALRPRFHFGTSPEEPHNIPFIVLGAGLLWFGWFGFNAGSAVSSGALATSAFVVTNTAAAMSALTWMTMTWWLGGRPTVVGAATGAVAGLVAITPASGFVTPMAAVIIGLGAGVFCYLACRLRARLKLDDSLDVWGCHGVGGTVGALATGLFATVAINAAGDNGLFYGNPGQLWAQFVAVAVVWVYSFTVTFIILKVLDKVMGITVEHGEEELGLDISQHGERAYV
ncbi:MAG: ammonium transporter [Chloroflexi bacterium]|nr:ammonium transporter [Chloroflexota bacterium]